MYVFLPLHLSHDACVSIDMPMPFLGGPLEFRVVCMCIAHGPLAPILVAVKPMYIEIALQVSICQASMYSFTFIV
jgi:hypothetical protein